MNPFRKSAKPFEEPPAKPIKREYPFVLISDDKFRIVMPNPNTFIIEKLCQFTDTMGGSSNGWLQQKTIKSTDKSYDGHIDIDLAYWILNKLAEVSK